MPITYARHVRLLLVALLLPAAVPDAASAHAVLLDSQPADGASLAEAPAQLVLRFSEPVARVSVRLIGQNGSALADVWFEARDAMLPVTPPGLLAPGSYFLSYRVTSLDAHAVGATLLFGVAAPAPGAPKTTVGNRGPARVAAAAQWLAYVTSLGAAGSALFLALLRPPALLDSRVRGLAAWLAFARAGALLLRLGTAGLDLAGLPLRSLATAQPWAAAAATSLAPASALAALGLAPIAVARRMPRWAFGLAALAVAASFALTGHAASAAARLLTAPALALHVLCATFWFGALLPLLWSLRLTSAEAAAVLQRFSLVAMVTVAALAAAGAGLAWVQLGGMAAGLFDTDYGRRLLIKLALVAGLLGLAALNRSALTPGTARTRPGMVRALRLTLAADLALAAGVLAVTSTFPFSPPPRALTDQEPGISVVASGRQGQAMLTLVPGRPGANRLQAGVADRDGAPLTAREASFAWSLPAAGIEPIHVAAALPLPGLVVADSVVLPQPGWWHLRLDLLVDDFTKLTYEGEINVR
jgi:copper transport protein